MITSGDIELLFDDYVWECEQKGILPEFDNWEDWWESLE